MPGPKVSPCGGQGQPACPPENSLVLAPSSEIALSFMNLPPDEQKAAIAANTGHPHHHFWHKFIDDLGNAIGEAKFGR